MGTFNTHQTITDRLKSLSAKLDKDHLTAQELQEFENLSRKLYERAVILNYKAKEENVYKKQDESQSAPVKEKTATKTKDEDNSTGEIKFDFTSDESFEESPSPVVEQDQKTADQGEDSPAGGALKEGHDPAVSTENDGEKEEESAEIEDAETAVEEDFPKERGEVTKSFYEHFMDLHKSTLSDQLGSSKIDTLKGAIGLNDKLQFISELFGRNREAFEEYLEQLDQQSSNREAHQLLSQIATKYDWDEENDLVEAFVKIISRRYADA
ncbi:MAG: hypothetical protein ACQERC_13320 [Bacteroidota bacterium]